MNYLDQTKIYVPLNQLVSQYDKEHAGKGGITEDSALLGSKFVRMETDSSENSVRYSTRTDAKLIKADGTISTTIDNNGSIGVNKTKKKISVNEPQSFNFDPNDNSSRFFIGTNIWDDNNWDSSIRANVDSQDDFLSDDLTSDNMSLSTFGKATGNSLKNLVTNKIGVVKDVKKLVGRLTNGEANPEVPDGTDYDKKFNYLKALKSEKYRNVKLNSVVGGTYNSLSNLLGFASGMLVGSLGKSSLSNTLDGFTSKFTSGLGIAGMLENVSGAIEAMPTVEEIAALNLARFDTMYEARPGRIVRDRFNRYNFITPNTTDGIDGTVSTSGKDTILNKILGKVNGVASKVTNAMNTASSWLNGSKFTEFIASKDLNGNNRLGGDQIGTDGDLKAYTIISEQRDNNFSQYIGSSGSVNNAVLGKQNGGKQSVRVGLNITDWTGQNYGGKYGILGTNPEIMDINGDAKGDVSKKGTDGGWDSKGWSKSDVFNRINSDYRKIGCLYIEPYYNDGNIECFQIPLQFNPTISDGGYEAKYQTQELLGRILSVRSYVGTDSQTVTLETKYIALAPTKSDLSSVDEGKESMNWMYEWDTSQIEKIEQLYRALVMPYMDVTYGTFVRPPIIRLKLKGYASGGENGVSDNIMFASGNMDAEYVGDLFKYPGSTLDDDKLLYVSNNLEGKKTREKRYIATALQINPLEDESLSYAYFSNTNSVLSKNWRRYGFSVNLTLAETTRNFLDIPPSFKEYYKANNSVSVTNYNGNYNYNGSDDKEPDLGDFTLDKEIDNLENTRLIDDYEDLDIENDAITDVASSFKGTDNAQAPIMLLAAMYDYNTWQGKEIA